MIHKNYEISDLSFMYLLKEIFPKCVHIGFNDFLRTTKRMG